MKNYWTEFATNHGPRYARLNDSGPYAGRWTCCGSNQVADSLDELRAKVEAEYCQPERHRPSNGDSMLGVEDPYDFNA